jgi:hypothetical protein
VGLDAKGATNERRRTTVPLREKFVLGENANRVEE